MEDQQVARGCGDQHLGAVGRQTHPHQVARVEELLVGAAVFREPAGSTDPGTGMRAGQRET